MTDANAIAAAARETGTSMFSCSALRFDREVLALKERLTETGPVRVAISIGYRELLYYDVHAAEDAGDGARSRRSVESHLPAFAGSHCGAGVGAFRFVAKPSRMGLVDTLEAWM